MVNHYAATIDQLDQEIDCLHKRIEVRNPAALLVGVAAPLTHHRGLKPARCIAIAIREGSP